MERTMKSLLLLVMALSLLAIAGGTARAQVVDSIVADIPFGFTVRHTTLPAGHYTIKRLGLTPDVMEIRGADYQRPVIFLVESAQVSNGPKRTELIFGDQYFLSKVFEEGNSIGVEVPPSRSERRLRKEGAMIQVHSVTVTGQND
jgi:hypothetical protein